MPAHTSWSMVPADDFRAAVYFKNGFSYVIGVGAGKKRYGICNIVYRDLFYRRALGRFV